MNVKSTILSPEQAIVALDNQVIPPELYDGWWRLTKKLLERQAEVSFGVGEQASVDKILQVTDTGKADGQRNYPSSEERRAAGSGRCC